MSNIGFRDNSQTLRAGSLDLTPGFQETVDSLLGLKRHGPFQTIMADPPWRFQNRTGKMAPEHRRLNRYSTMTLEDIKNLPVEALAAENAHLYLWVPNALLAEGLDVMRRWGFTYKTNIVWYKIRKDGGPDGRGVGFYFRNVTELILFGVRGSMRTLQPGRTQVNIIESRKREHSRKPDEQYELIESCSPGPYLELFARYARPGWVSWGNEVDTSAVDCKTKDPTPEAGAEGTEVNQQSVSLPRAAGDRQLRLNIQR